MAVKVHLPFPPRRVEGAWDFKNRRAAVLLPELVLVVLD